MPHDFERTVLTTYRTLRVAAIPLLLMLVVAAGLESTRGQDCLLGSISAYFHTPVRGAFVFSLAALGACLIAYKGNDAVEDVLLNFAGFMAFLVALVPTTVDDSCPLKYAGVVADAGTADAVRNNVLTLVVVSAIFLLLKVVVPRRVHRDTRQALGDDASVHAPSSTTGMDGRLRRARERRLTLAEVLGGVASLIVLAELALFAFWPTTFKDSAHGISAGTMVLGVLGVMVANAYGFDRATREAGRASSPWTNRYGLTAAATLVLIAASVLALRGDGHLILAVELVVIGGFVVFWWMQTRELWSYPTREEKVEDVERVRTRSATSAPSDARGRSVPGRGPAGVATRESRGVTRTATADDTDVAPVPVPVSRRELYKAL